MYPRSHNSWELHRFSNFQLNSDLFINIVSEWWSVSAIVMGNFIFCSSLIVWSMFYFKCAEHGKLVQRLIDSWCTKFSYSTVWEIANRSIYKKSYVGVFQFHSIPFGIVFKIVLRRLHSSPCNFILSRNFLHFLCDSVFFFVLCLHACNALCYRHTLICICSQNAHTNTMISCLLAFYDCNTLFLVRFVTSFIPNGC